MMEHFYDFIKKTSLKLVGFEPATNLLEEASVGTFKIFNEYFNAKSFRNEFGQRKASVVTSISMFYDLDNPGEFVEDVKKYSRSKWNLDTTNELFGKYVRK